METSLDLAIKYMGGQSALAAEIGVKQAHVWNWLNRQGRKAPANRVLAISAATGWRITPHELRPDIYPNPTDGLPAAKSGAAA
ncbi:Putative antitoxin of toxin-antitoxin system, YdaS/YdaT [Marinobacter sp. LV10R510-11A]|uniref:helix-turn-helix domain-containing protein n=1 Tax=Marinobacter sp. LV10R510-11A TaxID=1415568 RepID=UPI000BB8E900|nr:helix-turn-helix domain-containing protein [Marinobacter sp. LV10R510-11A]SOB76153.1 Putative antitoxin of toxin-antitoxin system, YdaS/YdaT [Marinobacter sp. LV10R510-11A]